MFFVFSKILTYLLSPTLWILVFFIAALLIKRLKLKRYCFRISLTLFVLFSNPFILNQFARWWDVKEAVLPANTRYSCAIVLGGYVSEDARENGYFNITADRFIQAVKLKSAEKVQYLLISGGNARLLPTEFRESNWVLSQLNELKVPDSSILVENQSRNSFENAKFSKKLLDSNNLRPPYLLITSAFHMRRAEYIYKKMGMDVIPFPCNYIAGREKVSFSNFIPSAFALDNWEFYIKEVVGYGIYVITDK